MYTYGILFSLRKEVNFGYYVKCNKPVTKGWVQYDPTYRGIVRIQIYRNSKKIGRCRVLRGGGNGCFLSVGIDFQLHWSNSAGDLLYKNENIYIYHYWTVHGLMVYDGKFNVMWFLVQLNKDWVSKGEIWGKELWGLWVYPASTGVVLGMISTSVVCGFLSCFSHHFQHQEVGLRVSEPLKSPWWGRRPKAAMTLRSWGAKVGGKMSGRGVNWSRR